MGRAMWGEQEGLGQPEVPKSHGNQSERILSVQKECTVAAHYGPVLGT